eukprot:evm.model.scf_79.12 EVM.evm.TU.scf_79.12   scf_79:100530-110053(-)
MDPGAARASGPHPVASSMGQNPDSQGDRRNPTARSKSTPQYERIGQIIQLFNQKRDQYTHSLEAKTRDLLTQNKIFIRSRYVKLVGELSSRTSQPIAPMPSQPNPAGPKKTGQKDQRSADQGTVLVDVKFAKHRKAGHAKERVQAMLLPTAKTIPKYTSWTYMKRNEMARDVGMSMFYTDESGETVPALQESVTEGAAARSGRNEPCENFCIRAVVEQFANEPCLVDALSLAVRLHPQKTEERVQEVIEDMRASSGLRNRQLTGLSDHLQVFFKHYCRRCRIFCCRRHQDCGNVRPHDRDNEKQPPLQPSLDTCGPNCWKLLGGRETSGKQTCQGAVSPSQSPQGIRNSNSTAATACRPPTSVNWTPLEEGLLRKGRKLFGQDSCRTARLVVTRTCQEVHEHPCVDPVAVVQDSSPKPKKSVIPKRRRKCFKPRRVGPKQLPKKAKNLMLSKRANHNPSKSWPGYQPCNCEGQCDVNCPCVQRGTWCEKFCACSTDCTVRFPGCKCKGLCGTKRCPCQSVGRDCDPDRCKCVGAAQAPDGSVKRETSCSNMCFSCGDHIRTAMGISRVAGWGAFLLGAANKGDFLGEYTGDLINDQEAERRGKAYDKEQHSYLFDLNDCQVLDAKRRGNKLRFANHSANPNCCVRHHLVDGDHRIGIFAACNMRPGEELLYDYQYYKLLGDRAPAWAVDKQDVSQPPNKNKRLVPCGQADGQQTSGNERAPRSGGISEAHGLEGDSAPPPSVPFNPQKKKRPNRAQSVFVVNGVVPVTGDGADSASNEEYEDVESESQALQD